MRFIIAINSGEGETSQTFDIVQTGSTNARTNKRKLKEYLTARGVHKKEHKTVLKKLGFWGATLGT